jgi:hypothetical protein
VVRKANISHLVERIELFTGEALNQVSAERISRQSLTYLGNLGAALQLSAVEDDQGLTPVETDLDELHPGLLRPVVGTPAGAKPGINNVTRGLQLLLFVPEIILPVELLGSVLLLSRLSAADEVDRQELRDTLRLLAITRPLILDGSISFVAVASRGRHPSGLTAYEDAAQDDARFQEAIDLAGVSLSSEVEPLFSMPRATVYMTLFRDLFASARLAQSLVATPFAQTKAEQLVLPDFFRGSLTDGRLVDLTKLGALTVPKLHGAVDEMVSIRKSEDFFAEFRQDMAGALGRVAGLGLEDARLAKQIVGQELTDRTRKVHKDLEKSTFASKMQVSAGQLTFGAAAAGVTSMFGASPWLGLAGTAGAKIAEAATQYVRALEERRRGKAVLTIAAAFTE